jgi:valyl-tRNA synthetase
MSLPKRYNPEIIEPIIQTKWELAGLYNFDRDSDAPVYSIDTPPATVSGKLHLGHTFSYSHPDFIARFWRMNGYNVFYPMGFDDNGLPTERLVEKQIGIRATDVGREYFNEICLKTSEQAEKEYQQLWQRLGLSIDWNYSYRTITPESRRISQYSFLDLIQKDLAYRMNAPAIWCPECKTSISQAELEDFTQNSEFYTLKFMLNAGEGENEFEKGFIKISTTRPEMLPACVAIFVNPDDNRFENLVGKSVEVPLFEQKVPILADSLVDPNKGTGIVMCCTFGDQTDVFWWRSHQLPLIEIIDSEGRLTKASYQFEGLSIKTARERIIETLDDLGFLITRTPFNHSIRVHERCDTPVEYINKTQWFIKVLDFKKELIEAGKRINWYPAYMESRYRSWVKNINWDWCISRQRFYGVPFPVWYCSSCGGAIYAKQEQLPVDPLVSSPDEACPVCGSNVFQPETDVMDTWGTSSLTTEIVGKWMSDPHLYNKVSPYSLRPQAHDIIRTWAFYTIVKSKFHFDKTPWQNALISGWGIAGVGMGKISKSRGGGPMSPLEMIETYSADAVRYWAASTGPGKDAVISEEKIRNGVKFINKIWNVARFTSRFIKNFTPPSPDNQPLLSPADKWALSRTQHLILRVTTLFQAYDYAAAKAEIEIFFWQFADNYLEMAKQRLYQEDSILREGSVFTLHKVLNSFIKLLAPILPHICEEIYQGVFSNLKNDGDLKFQSIHKSSWPRVEKRLINDKDEAFGQSLMDIASHIRGYKSNHNISLGTPLEKVQLSVDDLEMARLLVTAVPDLMSITRAQNIEITDTIDNRLEIIFKDDSLSISVQS